MSTKGRAWSKEQRKKFLKTMKKKQANKKAQPAEAGPLDVPAFLRQGAVGDTVERMRELDRMRDITAQTQRYTEKYAATPQTDSRFATPPAAREYQTALKAPDRRLMGLSNRLDVHHKRLSEYASSLNDVCDRVFGSTPRPGGPIDGGGVGNSELEVLFAHCDTLDATLNELGLATERLSKL